MPHQRYAELVELVVVQAELIQTFTARVAEPERPPRRGFVELKRVRRVVGFAVEQEARQGKVVTETHGAQARQAGRRSRGVAIAI